MILRGLLFLTTVSNCVLSLPVTSSHLENEDVKVMKCIVEALADVLSRPHPLPVSQECLVVLRTDDRLVSILRHHNFLKELQDIAVLGERAQLQGDITASGHVTSVPQSADDVPDRSMLDALGGPGERSILSQRKRTGTASEEEGATLDKESRERNEIDGKSLEKRERDERPDNHISDPINDWSENKEEKRDEEEEDEEEKRENNDGHESSEKRDTAENKSEEKKSAEEVDEEEEREKEGGGKEEEEVEKKRSTLFSHDASSQEEEEEVEEAKREMKAEDVDGLKTWTKRAKKLSVAAKKRGGDAEVAQARSSHQQEVPHHSKEEVTASREARPEESRRSPEVQELQMMARRRGTGEEEEEGSAGRKPEEAEIESLAAIESELESVAQKLHELRRG